MYGLGLGCYGFARVVVVVAKLVNHVGLLGCNCGMSYYVVTWIGLGT